MQQALATFRENLNRARSLRGLYSGLGTPALDLTDLLRASIVLAVSSFDHYIHELTRKGIAQAFAGARPRTDAYLSYRISLDALSQLLQRPLDPSPLDQDVRVQHSWQTFQRPDMVAEAIRLVTPKKIWNEVAKRVHVPAKDVRARLGTLVDRRNQIAHEADLDPTDPLSRRRWPITEPDVDSSLDFLEKIGEAIYNSIV